ncbi:hypothetical protein DFH28DRAFT_238869 [Melampsora americana]|nr:hypothetical protein DFH28DRAFT_238869 [Melampsora americana]
MLPFIYFITIITILSNTQAQSDPLITSTAHQQLLLQPQIPSHPQQDYNHPEQSTSSDLQMPSTLPAEQASVTSDPSSPKGLSNLTGALTLQTKLSLFYNYIRDVAPINQRTMDPNQKTTILAPLNAAIMRLSRKPHQGLQTPESEAPFHELSPEAKIAREESNLSYLTRWVSAHVILDTLEPEQFPSSPQSSLSLKSIDGRSLRIVCDDSQDGEPRWHGCRIEPGNIRIINYTPASNGVIYTIDNTILVDDE